MLSPQPLARPMSIGDLLDRAITIYRRNFRTLVAIAAIVDVPLLIVQIVAAVIAFPVDFTTFARRSTSSAFDTSFLTYFLVVGIASIIASIASVFEHGAIITVISEVFQSASIGIREAYARAFRRGWAMLGALIMIGALYLGIIGAIFVPFFALLVGAGGATSVGAAPATAGLMAILAFAVFCLGLIPAIVLFNFFQVKWLFSTQAIMLEAKGARAGLGRSWRLVRGSFWRVFGIDLITNIFIGIVTLTPAYAISFTAILFPSPLVSTVLNTTVGILIGIFVTPIRIAILTLLYYDLRIRKEGFDLELRAKQLGQEPAAASE